MTREDTQTPISSLPYRLEKLGNTLFLAVSDEHRFGSDAFLLADFAGQSLRHKDYAVDLGTGCGIIAFLLYKNQRPSKMWGIDIQPQAIDQFRFSVDYSIQQGEDISDILQAECCDLKNIKSCLPAGKFDLVTCNPPYKTGGTGILSAAPAHQIARHELLCSIDDVCAAAAWLLKSGGRLCLCQRPERLCDTLGAMRAHHIEPKRLRFVAKNENTNPWLFLVEGKKDAKSYMDVLPTLIFDQQTAARLTHYGDYE